MDVKLSYDEYRRQMCAVATSRTIFIVNPNSQEGFALYNYVKLNAATIDYAENDFKFDEIG